MPSNIQINHRLSLVVVDRANAANMYDLMKDLYLDAYSHLWSDKGYWYLDHAFSLPKVISDLAVQRSRYFYIHHDEEPIGILRIIIDEPFDEQDPTYQVKLNRIYLTTATQGLGLGKKVMNWVEHHYCSERPTLLWLEVMDSQKQALVFYENLGFIIREDFRLPFERMHSSLRGMHRMYKLINRTK